MSVSFDGNDPSTYHHGIVSTGMTYQPEDADRRKPYGTVALLRPLQKMKPLLLDDASEWISIADEIATGRIGTV